MPATETLPTEEVQAASQPPLDFRIASGETGLLSFALRQRLVILSALVLLYNEVFGGVLRWIFHSVGATPLAYLPAVCAFGTVAVVIISSDLRAQYDVRVFSMVAFVVLYGVYGFIDGRTFGGAAYALWTWIPVFLGLLIVRYRALSAIVKHLPILLLLSIAGVLITYWRPVPWMGGDSYTVGGLQVSATRAWNAMGVTRLPGFSRASYTAANDMAVFLVWLLCIRQKLIIKIVLWVASVAGVLLTTSKTPLFLLVIAPPIMWLFGVLSRDKASERLRAFYSYAVTAALLGLMVGLPYVDLSKAAEQRLPFDDVLPFMRLDSVLDRGANTWPLAFSLVQNGSHPALEGVLGRGLGGIGLGQLLSDRELYNSADNMHVYLYIAFGVCCLVFYLPILFGYPAKSSADGMPPSYHLATVTCVLVLGTLTGLIEGAVPALAFGMLLSSCLAPVRKMMIGPAASRS